MNYHLHNNLSLIWCKSIALNSFLYSGRDASWPSCIQCLILSTSRVATFQRSCSLVTSVLNEFLFLLRSLLASLGAFMKAFLTWIGAGLSPPYCLSCFVKDKSFDPFRGYVFVCYCNIWSCYHHALEEYMMSNTTCSKFTYPI